MSNLLDAYTLPTALGERQETSFHHMSLSFACIGPSFGIENIRIREDVLVMMHDCR